MAARPWKVVIDTPRFLLWRIHASYATEASATKAAPGALADWREYLGSTVTRVGIMGPFEDGSRVKWLDKDHPIEG